MESPKSYAAIYDRALNVKREIGADIIDENSYAEFLAEHPVYFLDMKAETNMKQVVFMQRRDMREYFLPPEENYYQNASKELDIYGLGKTFQYILASSETEPHLNRWEEHRLQSIISKTMGTKGSYYQSVSEIQKQIPKWKEKVNKESSGDKGKRRWKLTEKKYRVL